MERKFTELEQVRRDKVKELQNNKILPWGRDVEHTHNSRTLEEEFSKYSKEELETKDAQASVVGRIMTKRGPFIIGKDSKGPIQGYVPKDIEGDSKLVNDQLDLGDIVKMEGTVMKTGTGTLSIRIKKLILLSKSLKPLPEKFHGLKDVEERYRRRYVDLLMNEDVKEVFWTRTKIITLIREYFDNQEYMEVETPVLHPILGGASARPFETHHNALDMPFYLRIATELPLKKLLVGGIDRVYEIGRIFRNEGIDTTHNPEFTSIEFYEAYSNNEGMMKRTEEVISFIADKLGKKEIEYNGNTISLKTPFKRLNMVDAVSEATGKDFKEISFDEAKEVAKKHNIEIPSYYKVGHIINDLFEELIEHTIVQPTFVYGHPVEVSPLAAINLEDPRFTDRAELFIDGREYANMFTELNDPIDQLERFEHQFSEKEAGNDEASEIDMEFIDALEYGMPPAGGCGIGIDRLVMLFTGKESIREVLIFPHLRNK